MCAAAQRGIGIRMDRATGSPPVPGDQRREPSRRALHAMASAARRAQERRGAPSGLSAPGSPPASPSEVGERRLVARSTSARRTGRGSPAPPDRGQGAPSPQGTTRVHAAPVGTAARSRTPARVGIAEWLTGWRLASRRHRGLVMAGMVGLLLIAGIALALALSLGLRSPRRGPAGAVRRPSSAHHAQSSIPKSGGTAANAPRKDAHRKPGRASTSTSPKPATTPPSTKAAPATAGGPTIASASPSGASPGQTVVISGRRLFSSDGQVVAYFGGAAAPTSCSSQSSCTATVPNLGGGRSTVELTVVTASGRSNALRFSYR